jgi:hypothetical protein
MTSMRGLDREVRVGGSRVPLASASAWASGVGLGLDVAVGVDAAWRVGWADAPSPSPPQPARIAPRESARRAGRARRATRSG